MNPDLGTELRSGRVISSSSETPIQTDPDMAQSSANDSDSNEVSDISSQLSEIKESYERKINELQNEFSQLKDLMMAVISKTDTENRQSTSKGPSKPTHTVGFDTPLLQPAPSNFHASYHVQNSVPCQNVSEVRYTGCMVCGRSVDSIKDEKVKWYMQRSTPRVEPEYITRLRKEAVCLRKGFQERLRNVSSLTVRHNSIAKTSTRLSPT